MKVTHAVASAFEDFGFIVAAFNKTICPWDFHGVNDLMKPVVVGFGAVMELWKIHNLNRQQPVCKGLLAHCSRLAADHRKEVIFNTVGIC